MTKRKRFLTIPRLAGLFILLLLLALMGFWVFIRSQLVSGLEIMVSALQTQGYQINHGDVSVLGFPLVIDAKTETLLVKAPPGNPLDLSKNWSVKTGPLVLKSATLSPLSWTIVHKDPMHIDSRGRAGNRYIFDINPADFRLFAAVNLQGNLKAARLNLKKTQIQPRIGEAPILRALDGLNGHYTARGGDGHIDMTISNLALGNQLVEPLKTALGQTINHVFIDATIDNIQSCIDGDFNDWQSKGAHVNVKTFNIVWGDLDVISNLDMTLAGNQMQGLVTLKIANIETLTPIIKAANITTAEQFQFMSAALHSMPKNKDGRTELAFPIKNSKLMFFGQVIADLNP